MDIEGTDRISTNKIEEHLQNSGVYSSPLSQALKALSKKLNDDSEVDGRFSLSKLMNWLGRSYNPVIAAAMKLRYVVIIISSALVSINCVG